MKSGAWAQRFANEEAGKVLADFACETSTLVDERTKSSGVIHLQLKNKKVNTKIGARDGALREQKQKWAAVQRLRPELANITFESVLTQYLPTVQEAISSEKEDVDGEADKQESVTVEENCNGRKLAATLAVAGPATT